MGKEHHFSTSASDLRAAVLGANDGLVSNFCLLLGIAGSGIASREALLAGAAGLVAGACSMALGEWLSMNNSRELARAEMKKEARELREQPAAERLELQRIYEARGLSPEDAREVTLRLMADPEIALATHAREELGIDPDGLGGSANSAAIVSFLMFAGGALLPLLPLIFELEDWPFWTSIASLAGLIGIGAVTARFNQRGIFYSSARQALIGAVAATITFGVGYLLGVTVS